MRPRFAFLLKERDAWPMEYRVFAQGPDGRVNLAQLVQNARRYFEATLEVLEERGLVGDVPAGPGPSDAPWARLRLSSERRGFDAVMRVSCRPTTADDWDAARRAEQSGRATGMAQLAARCPTVWEVKPESGESPVAILNLCAVLASVALGPVIPPDESTLFGIRGAMERVDALTTRSLAR